MIKHNYVIKVSIIVAVSQNGVIGHQGQIPWEDKADLKRFRKLTKGHNIIMGRKTFESLGSKPLDYRKNIVISSTLKPQEGIEVVSSLEEALEVECSTGEIFIIGGEQVYKEALEKEWVTDIYLTFVPEKVEGDTYFPDYNNYPDELSWELVDHELNFQHLKRVFEVKPPQKVRQSFMMVLDQVENIKTKNYKLRKNFNEYQLHKPINQSGVNLISTYYEGLVPFHEKSLESLWQILDEELVNNKYCG